MVLTIITMEGFGTGIKALTCLSAQQDFCIAALWLNLFKKREVFICQSKITSVALEFPRNLTLGHSVLRYVDILGSLLQYVIQ